MTLRQLLRKPFVKVATVSPVDLTGKHMIVTGASEGSLGYATAKQLASWGAKVIITTRSNADEVIAALKSELKDSTVNSRIAGYTLDLTDVTSVATFAQWYQDNFGERLDCLINNAGIHLDLMSKWSEPTLSDDGFEIHWRTNYLGTAQLTHGLLPLLKVSGKKYGEARVVNVVSQLHSLGSNASLFDKNTKYNSWRAYGLSKLALMHFTSELNRRFASSDNVKAYSLHPGGKTGTYTNVASKGLEGHPMIELLRKLGSPIEKFFMTTADEGAQTQIHCAVSVDAKSGHYHQHCAIGDASPDSKDARAAERLWNETIAWIDSLQK